MTNIFGIFVLLTVNFVRIWRSRRGTYIVRSKACGGRGVLAFDQPQNDSVDASSVGKRRNEKQEYVTK